MQEIYANDPIALHLRRELVSLFGTARNVCLLAFVAFLAGLSGPFGTYDALSMVERHLFWVLVVFGTAAVGHGSGSAAEIWLIRMAWTAKPRLLAASVLTMLPVFGVMVVVLLSFGFRPDGGELVLLFAQCAAVVSGVTIIAFLTDKRGDQIDGAVVPQLIKRLPHAKRGRLVRLAAQDHYVEVVTAHGRTLVSMRFRDAIAETAPEPGAQVHRSHWVALHAVSGRSRAGDKTGLRLCDDSFVPIGRKFKTAARQNGLI